MMLVRCLYASRIDKANAKRNLADILESSRRNNVKLGITGVLISAGDCYIQALEGGRSQVCALYNLIAQDKRHKDVTMLSFQEISQRGFESWSMGQVVVEQMNPAILLKYSATSKLDPFAMTGAATLSLLNELVASGTVVCGNAPRGNKA